MPTVLTDSEKTAEHPRARTAPERGVSLAEALFLAAAVTVGVVALVALAAAHLGVFGPALVAVVSLVALAVLGVLAWRLDRVPVHLDRGGLAPLLVGVALAAIFFFPGFQYGTGDKDPGVYVETAVAITTHGSLPFPDDLVQAGLPGGLSPGAEWPGLWDQPGHPGQIFPQFYHLWPALLATAKEAGGFTGLFDTGPLLGVLVVGIVVLIARRIAGLAGAWTAALVLPTNMLQVWQSKYPSSEVFGELLFVAAVLGVVLALRTGWRSAAVAGGVLVSLGYLERPDGVLMIIFAWVVLCALLAAGRFDRRAGLFAAGLLVLLPYGLLQAYHLARGYTLANNIPTMRKLLGGMVVLAALAALAAWQRPRWAGLLRWADRPRSRLLLGSTYIGVCAVLVVIGGLRPKLFGVTYSLYQGRTRIRSYNEISFIRLTWFFSLTGIALMCLGIAYVGWRRWRLDRWLIALATTGLLALYCYNLRNSPYMMWSTRRFVTTVVPGMVLLMACGSAALVLVVRYLATRVAAPERVRVPVTGVAVAALLIGLALFQSSQSRPLRHHDENGGSVEVATQLSALSGDRKGVYLFQKSGACCSAPYQLFGGPMMTIVDESSALLPKSGSPTEAGVVKQYVDEFKAGDRPVFYVANGTNPPPTVPGVTATKVRELVGSLPHWEETYVSRPKKSGSYNYSLTVYRLQPDGG